MSISPLCTVRVALPVKMRRWHDGNKTWTPEGVQANGLDGSSSFEISRRFFCELGPSLEALPRFFELLI
jgi:hypothetical protein